VERVAESGRLDKSCCKTFIIIGCDVLMLFVWHLERHAACKSCALAVPKSFLLLTGLTLSNYRNIARLNKKMFMCFRIMSNEHAAAAATVTGSGTVVVLGAVIWNAECLLT